MKRIELEPQPEIVTVDEATRALLEEARESARNGEVFTPEQSRAFAREQYEKWQKQQDKITSLV